MRINEPTKTDPLVPKNGEAHVEILSTESNGHLRGRGHTSGPPDGGVRAYAVVIASFLTNGLLFGVINSYGVIYTVLQDQLKNEGVANSEIKASLVGSLAMGSTFLLSPVSGILADLLGLRLTAVLGGGAAALGMLLSSFITHHVVALCFTYGIMYGAGASLAYTPSLAILGHYFKKHLGLVNGIVCIGSSVFTVAIPPLMKYVLNEHGLEWTFRVLAVLTFGIALCGLLFKPMPLNDHESFKDNKKSILKSIVDVKIWKNMTFRLWALSMPIALFGYFVPYVHIGKFVKTTFPTSDETLPIQCIGVTSGIGRLLFGFLADKPIDKIMLQQIAFYVIGTLTIMLPFVPHYVLLVGIALGMGVFDGAFIALMGPIAFELCGRAAAAKAIGATLGLAALPLSVGPAVAGVLLEARGSYALSFVLAGLSPLLGATLMFAARYYARKAKKTNTNGHVAPPENGTVGIALTSSRTSDENGVKREPTRL